ncbi:MAG: TIGR01212 family radical SAM protein [Deltaproteobacteria bacterium]|nr:TIGR01212 family radical SAM protein [Deltaproteobacteria bacterium]
MKNTTIPATRQQSSCDRISEKKLLPTRRYRTLKTHLKDRYGGIVKKIPLDAGLSCPNRDGTISTKGCAFCNPRGSGTGLAEIGLTLADQYMLWHERFESRDTFRGYLAYLQSFTNTHAPAPVLRNILSGLRGLPDLIGLCIGTRPDCLDEEKTTIIAKQDYPETWVEIGLQTSCDETLRRINRGHTSACFARAARMVSRQGLQICVHVIAGLPGESPEDFLRTINFLNDLPVHGIKIHCCYVGRNTTLAKWWTSGNYHPLSMEEYASWAAAAVIRLRPDIVIHRLNSDPAPGELLAPGWIADKPSTLREIHHELRRSNIVPDSSRQTCPQEPLGK